MKKILLILIANIIFCVVVIFVCRDYYDIKTKRALAYNHAASYVETTYKIEKENIEPLELDYRRGQGLFEMLLQDTKTKDKFSFTVDIGMDYQLFYFKDHTEVYRKNEESKQ